MQFQSTLPRGERQRLDKIKINKSNFNPRSHEGSDCSDIGKKISDFRISIHAPTRGATVHQHITWMIAEDFNPRSHEGSDEFRLYLVTLSQISIHAPTRGATHNNFITVLALCEFQSTLPRGERHRIKLIAYI